MLAVTEALGDYSIQFGLDGLGGYSAYDADGEPLMSYIVTGMDDFPCGPICCRFCPGNPCECPDSGDCPCNPLCRDYDPCHPDCDNWVFCPDPCDEDPCDAACATSPCDANCGGDPCAQLCEDGGVSCCDHDPCDPACPTSNCNPACGGDPCAPECEGSGFPCPCDEDPCHPDCPDAPCKPECGGNPCAPHCPNPPPCLSLQDCEGDEDDEPEYVCVGDVKQYNSLYCPAECQEDCTPTQWHWSVTNPAVAEITTMPAEGSTIEVEFIAPGAVTILASNGCCAFAKEVVVVLVDLDIDSDNDDGYETPGRTPEEEELEDAPDEPGKFVLVNNADSDADGIPDWADGFNFNDDPAFEQDNESTLDIFIPLRLSVTVGDADEDEEEPLILFDYDASDPAAMESLPYGRLAPAPGSLRLWTTAAPDERDMRSVTEGGHFVPTDTDISLADLDADSDGQVVLWLEAVRASDSLGDAITVKYHDCDDTIRVTAYTTQYVAVGPGGIASQPDEYPRISHPTPTIFVSNGTLSNVRPADDGITLLADLHVTGTVDDAFTDLYGGTINSINVFLNEESITPYGSDTPVTIPVTPGVGASPDPLLKPYDFTGGFSSTIVDVPVSLGVNTLTLHATNSRDYTGFASYAFEINATPPADVQYFVDLTLTANQSTGYDLTLELLYGPVGGDLESFVAMMMPPDDDLVYGGKFYGALVDVGGMHDHIYEPSAPDTLIVDILIREEATGSILMDELVIVTETGNNSETFVGDATLEDHERLTWDGYTFTVTHFSTSASDGGGLVPYAQEVVPAGMHAHLTHLEVFIDDDDPDDPVRTYWVQDYGGRSFLMTPGAAIPSLITLLDNAEQEESFFQTLQSGELDDLFADLARFGAGYAEGYINGLWDTGVALIDDLGTIAQGTWHLLWHYNNFAIGKRIVYHSITGEGDGLVLDEDEEKIEALAEFAGIIAEVVFQVMQDQLDAAYALLAQDQDELNRLGEQYRIVGEYLIEILIVVRDEILSASAGDLGYAAGWINGRITGEVLIEVGGALASGGASVSIRAGRIAGATARIATKFDSLATDMPNVPGMSPQLMNTIADKVEGMTDYLHTMSTTTMCFVAGTLVHTDVGLTPIENIRPGDLVLSRDAQTASMGYKPVVQTFQTHPDSLYTLEYEVDGLTGNDELAPTLTGTGEHPLFSVDVDAFVPMGEMKIGDRLLLEDGVSTAHVTDIQVQRGPPHRGTFTTYNFEVADWHTYFVGEVGAGVWVHNRGPACQRIFAILADIRKDFPGIGYWDSFEQLLWRTTSGSRRKVVDPSMTGVVRHLMDATYNDAILPNGTVDLNKVKSVSQIQAFRNLPVAQDRLPGELLHNHHTVPQEWARVLYRQIYGEEPTQLWLDSMPGWLMEVKDHVPDGYGSANFHTILRRQISELDIDVDDPGSSSVILNAIETSYEEWDPVAGPKIWRVSKAWLENEGIQ